MTVMQCQGAGCGIRSYMLKIYFEKESCKGVVAITWTGRTPVEWKDGSGGEWRGNVPT